MFMALLMAVLCWIVAVCGMIDNVYEKKQCLLFLPLALLIIIACIVLTLKTFVCMPSCKQATQ